jgi:hypothetical protein
LNAVLVAAGQFPASEKAELLLTPVTVLPVTYKFGLLVLFLIEARMIALP